MASWLTNFHSRWRPLKQMERELPAEYLFWLRDAKSLTQHLKELSKGEFAVDLLSHGKARPYQDERNCLGLTTHNHALIRQVRLLCSGQAVVFARTVIPDASLSGRHRLLARLGTRPLGELLFSDKSMRRGEVEVAVFPVSCALFRLIDQHDTQGQTTIWGRRSVFYLEGKPLLVSEFFLPSILDFGM